MLTNAKRRPANENGQYTCSEQTNVPTNIKIRLDMQQSDRGRAKKATI